MIVSRSLEIIDVEVRCNICLNEIEHTAQLLSTSCNHTFNWLCFNTKVTNCERCPVYQQSTVCWTALQSSLLNLTVNTDLCATQSLPEATMTRTRNQRLDESSAESANLASEANDRADAPSNESQQTIVDVINSAAIKQTELMLALQQSIQGMITAFATNLRVETEASPPLLNTAAHNMPSEVPRSPATLPRCSHRLSNSPRSSKPNHGELEVKILRQIWFGCGGFSISRRSPYTSVLRKSLCHSNHQHQYFVRRHCKRLVLAVSQKCANCHVERPSRDYTYAIQRRTNRREHSSTEPKSRLILWRILWKRFVIIG